MNRHHKRICIESPLSGDLERNIQYARVCMLHVLELGHAPFASHLLYTQVLDDDSPRDRELGILAGLTFGDSCEERWFFTDFGMSPGMQAGCARATEHGQKMKSVQLGEDWRDLLKVRPTEGF